MNFGIVIQWFFSHLNYWTVTLLMMVESSFIPFPSEIVVPPAAYVAATTGEMSMPLVFLFSTLGATLGALFNYYMALWLGRPLVNKFVRSRIGRMCLLSPDKVDRADEMFRKRGAVSTFVGRMIPGVRQLISVPAGLSKMKLQSFVLYTFLGAGLWNSVLMFIGYSLSHIEGIDSPEKIVEHATKYSHIIGYIIMAIVAVALIVLFIKHRISKQNKI